MRIAITGATGLLGRNLLFEILKQNIDNLANLEVILLGRGTKNRSIHDRIKEIAQDDGLDYIGIDQKDRASVIKDILNSIVPISFDLSKDGLAIAPEDMAKIKKGSIDCFFHVAARTDFRSDSNTRDKLIDINVNGTGRVLSLIKNLSIGQFIYIGSAYSCGSKTGLVKPDYINLNEKFRNPYEESKLRAEILVRDFCRKIDLAFKIFRPSTICGRLIEKQIGSTPKFDVFYAWGAFFLRMKMKQIKDIKDLYSTKLNFPIRIHFNPNSGLNIVAADFAAKILYQAVFDQWKGDSFHLANKDETPHREYTNIILKAIGIEGFSIVGEEPKDKNEFERFYYKTVGKIFTPYALSDPILFDLSNVENNRNKLEFQAVNRNSLKKLIDYAKNKYFNLV